MSEEQQRKEKVGVNLEIFDQVKWLYMSTTKTKQELLKIQIWNYKLKDSNVLPALNYSGIEEPIVLQDNAPCYKAKSVVNFLKEKKNATAALAS